MATRPSSDADYFHKRAIEEQVAAQRAECPAARERHDEMAAMYRFREWLTRDLGQVLPVPATETASRPLERA